MELTQESVEKLDVGQNEWALFCKGLLLDAIEAGDKLEAENERLKAELEKVKNIVDCKIRLVLMPKYLMDILSIREWNDLVTSYEKDGNVTIHDNMDKYIAFDTTLGNVVCNHSLLDLRFVSQSNVPKEEK